jgi:SAM-dependent methyltransferase
MQTKPEILREEYQIRFLETEKYRNNVWKILCSEYFSRFVPIEAHVLDLGCGWGEFINNIGAAKKYAMDLNPDTATHLNKEVCFLHQDCSREWEMQSESLDIVFTSNFLEHLTDKRHIEFAMSETFRCLKHDGLIICLGPNIKYVGDAYWDFWDHFIPITEASLSELLRLKGFSIELCNPRFLPYSMATSRKPPLLLVKLYLKHSFIWPFFGKQFLIIGKKNRIV